MLRRIARLNHSLAIAAGAGIGLVVASAAALAPLVAPYDPQQMLLESMLQGPSWSHPLGTDPFGRDVLSRTIFGARITLFNAILATGLGVGAGTLLGMTAAYVGGWIDEALMRFADAWMSIPSLVLAMLLLTGLGSGAATVIASIAIVFTPRVARVVRAATLNIKGNEFVAAAKVRGESGAYIVLSELLPNLWAPITVEASIRVSYAILLVTSLGYLGIGVQPPAPDWGLMMGEARQYLTTAPWMITGPVIGIIASVVAVNLLADGIQEILDTEKGLVSHVG